MSSANTARQRDDHGNVPTNTCASRPAGSHGAWGSSNQSRWRLITQVDRRALATVAHAWHTGRSFRARSWRVNVW